MTDQGWVKEAMTDDAVVVEMLLRLHSANLPPPLRLKWTVRQRRSRPVSRLLADSSNGKAETTRASPTTPLSWSGATSHSGADGFEDSSRHARPLDPARSKVAVGTSETTATKRPRKKKTLAEFKEEESLLLKERRSLKSELATLCQRLEHQRATNESLKRMKLDHTFKTVTSSSEETISDQLQHTEGATDPSPSTFPAIIQCHSSLLLSSCAVQEVESGFLLPDLNVPLEDDYSGSKVFLYDGTVS